MPQHQKMIFINDACSPLIDQPALKMGKKGKGKAKRPPPKKPATPTTARGAKRKSPSLVPDQDQAMEDALASEPSDDAPRAKRQKGT